MAYRVTYAVSIDWIGPGSGPMSGQTAGVSGINDLPSGMGPAGGAQRLTLFNTPAGQFTNTFTSSDITTLTNGIASDMAAQFTTNQARVQGFATGGG